MNAFGFDFYNLNKSQQKKKTKNVDSPSSQTFSNFTFQMHQNEGKMPNIFSLIPIGNSKQPRMRPTPRVLTSNKDLNKKHNEQRDDILYEALVFMATTSYVRNCMNLNNGRGDLWRFLHITVGPPPLTTGHCLRAPPISFGWLGFQWEFH